MKGSLICDDSGTKEALAARSCPRRPTSRDHLQFLMTHLRAFMQALDSLGKSPLSIGNIRPTPGIVDQYHNDSTGEGDHGEIDADVPWKMADGITVVESPALNEFQVLSATPKAAKTKLGCLIVDWRDSGL
jgi:Mn-containing catalase